LKAEVLNIKPASSGLIAVADTCSSSFALPASLLECVSSANVRTRPVLCRSWLLQGPLKLLGSPTAALAAAKFRFSSNSSSATPSSLAKENAALKARLAKVEEAAAEALGELQDAQDELDAHKEARQAAEQQVRPMKPLCRGVCCECFSFVFLYLVLASFLCLHHAQDAQDGLNVYKEARQAAEQQARPMNIWHDGMVDSLHSMYVIFLVLASWSRLVASRRHARQQSRTRAFWR
jgi:hypothetical protein